MKPYQVGIRYRGYLIFAAEDDRWYFYECGTAPDDLIWSDYAGSVNACKECIDDIRLAQLTQRIAEVLDELKRLCEGDDST